MMGIAQMDPAKVSLILVQFLSHIQKESSGEKTSHSDSNENGNFVQETIEPMAGTRAGRSDFEPENSLEPEHFSQLL
jgi:hypothetical protein